VTFGGLGGSVVQGFAVGLGAPAARRLLLVEDDEGDAFLVRELLDESDASRDVTWVRSLAEARTAMAESSFDCVLMDLGLPDATGLDALRDVLDEAADTAVLVLTGLADEQSGTAAMAAGAQDYLVKGQVDGELLTRSIRYAVERKRADEQLRRLYASELRESENTRLERGLLPHPLTRDTRLSITTRYRSGRDGVLGGDFFDVVETADERLFILVGDVCGHGPDEAALGVALRIAWRTLVLAAVDVDGLLPTLDTVLVGERRFDEVFATLAMLVVEPSRHRGRLFLAGHPAPLLLDRTPVQLPDNLVGPALGMLPGVTWGSRIIELGPDWRLMLFSDGLVEGKIGQGSERLGVERLLEIAQAFPAYDDTAALVDHLIARAHELHGGELTDDVAVLVVECSER
jgi:serine phosphatase RsbU (regulator of sigma subunit)